MELKATPKSLDDVLRLQRKYVIPRFQREFAWETDELAELYDDLMKRPFNPPSEMGEPAKP